MRWITSLFIGCVVILATTSVASANPIRLDPTTINVAEFRWHVEGESCNPLQPTQDDCLSILSLSYFWDGPTPGPVVSGNLSIDNTPFSSWFDLDESLPFDQLATTGVPGSVEASISFLFGSSPMTLTALLLPSAALFTPEGVFHIFQFNTADIKPIDPKEDPKQVPEPGSIWLASLAVLSAWRFKPRR